MARALRFQRMCLPIAGYPVGYGATVARLAKQRGQRRQMRVPWPAGRVMLCAPPLPRYAAMSQAEQNLRIDYIEFAAVDLPLLKQFYEQVFGWRFTDYGPHYSSFTDGRMTGGFTTDSAAGSGPLVVIYAADLEAVCDQVAAAGGQITQEIFSFPGGRRFEFRDPSGNRLAVWSE